MVEFAIVLPVLVILGLAGVSINTFIQARSQLSQAVSHAVLTAAREAQDPCMPGTVGDPTSAPGYDHVVAAFQKALTATVFQPSTAIVPAIVCTTRGYPGPVCITNRSVLKGTCAISTDPQSVQDWFANPAHAYPCYRNTKPQDSGCFSIWRGGLVTVAPGRPQPTAPPGIRITLRWIPLFNTVNVFDQGGEQLEPFRVHVCAPPPRGSFPVSLVGTTAC